MRLKIKTSSFINIFKHPLMGVSFLNWLRILAQVKFRFHFLLFPKIIFITINSLLNAPLQIGEYLIYARRINKQVVDSPVFILGHFRSGTTYLHYLLSRDEQFAFCTVYDAILPHISLFRGKLFKMLIAFALPSRRPQDNVRIMIDSPKEEEFALANMSRTSFMFSFYFPQEAKRELERSVLFSRKVKDLNHWKKNFDFFIKKMTFKYGGKPLLLKSPANTGRVKQILELYPNARFIHISRDPYEVYRSTLHLYEKIVPITSFQVIDKSKIEDHIVNAYRLIYEKYHNDTLDLNSDQLIEISFSDLESDPILTLKQIYEGLNLKGFDDAVVDINHKIREYSNYKKNKYLSLDSRVKMRLKKEWGSVALKMGYKL